MKTINASDLGTYLYCQRAWWYRQQGVESGNQKALAGGTQLHSTHGRKVFVSGALRTLGWLLLLAGMVGLALVVTLSIFGS